MKKEIYRNIFLFGLAAVLIFSPLVKGAVQLWSISLIELVVLLLVFTWFWKINNEKEQGFRKTTIDFPLWTFVVLAAISCVFSIYKHASLIEILRLMTMVGVYYLVVNNFDRKMSLRLGTSVIIMGTAMSLFGLAQYFLGLEHSWWIPENLLASTYVNHNHFAGYLELAIPLAIGIFLGQKVDSSFFRFKTLMLKLGLVVALMIMLGAFVFSQSRGAWICLLISLIVMNMILIRRKVLDRKSLIIFLLFIVLAVGYLYAGYDPVAERLRSVEQINEESFLSGRMKIWSGSINMIKHNSLIGTGLGTFVWGFPSYRPEGLDVRAHYAHNDYLHMMAEMGFLALPLMLWMIYLVIQAGLRWKSKSENANFEVIDGIILGSAVGILSLALHGLVDFNFHIPANMLVVAALSGIIMRRA